MDASFHGFRNSNLNGLNFDNANISGIDFQGCNLSDACFNGARLSSVTFSSDMDLSAANFSGLRHAHNVQIMDSEGRVQLTLNSADEFRSFIASGQQLDQQQAQWQQRLSDYANERDRLRAAGLSQTDLDNALSELQTSRFDELERKRVQALDADL